MLLPKSEWPGQPRPETALRVHRAKSGSKAERLRGHISHHSKAPEAPFGVSHSQPECFDGADGGRDERTQGARCRGFDRASGRRTGRRSSGRRGGRGSGRRHGVCRLWDRRSGDRTHGGGVCPGTLAGTAVDLPGNCRREFGWAPETGIRRGVQSRNLYGPMVPPPRINPPPSAFPSRGSSRAVRPHPYPQTSARSAPNLL